MGLHGTLNYQNIFKNAQVLLKSDLKEYALLDAENKSVIEIS